MQLFREKPGHREKQEKPRKVEIDYGTMTIIDPRSKFLPLDDCDRDDY